MPRQPEFVSCMVSLLNVHTPRSEREPRYCASHDMSTRVLQHIGKICASLLSVAAIRGGVIQLSAQAPGSHAFTLARDAEVVASITAGCARCDWGVSGREAAALTLSVDGTYSQHLLLTRGEKPAPYRVMLGFLRAGTHQLQIERDAARSAAGAGAVTIGSIDVQSFAADAPEFPWLSRAPVLRAAPGSVETFSDAPRVLYAEPDVPGESGSRYDYQYTVIFTNEDGGTPTDRLMATWGRTTDIEFVYGITSASSGGAPRDEIQAAGHKWIPFGGSRLGTHPVLWVATENNMVADHGPGDASRFAPAPEMVVLNRVSRESVMDERPWTYAVTSAEMVREGRIDPDAAAGSGRIPDPRRYATVEGFGEVRDATLAFDIGVRRAGHDVEWYPTDRGDVRFRIARGGCFRGGAPLPDGVSPADLAALRIRAYTRPPHEGEAPLPPGTGRVTLQRINRVFMLDRSFVPALSPIQWTGTLSVPTDSTPVLVPLARH